MYYVLYSALASDIQQQYFTFFILNYIFSNFNLNFFNKKKCCIEILISYIIIKCVNSLNDDNISIDCLYEESQIKLFTMWNSIKLNMKFKGAELANILSYYR